MSKATDLKFGKRMHMDNFSKRKTSKFRKGAWPSSRDHYKIWNTLKYICKTCKATNLKFDTTMHMDNFSKTKNKNTQMGRGLGHFTFINSDIL